LETESRGRGGERPRKIFPEFRVMSLPNLQKNAMCAFFSETTLLNTATV
jgi:hypothetical protein